MWESIFAREIGGVSLVPMQCNSWRQRFFLSQSMPDLSSALFSAENGDEIVLCPGVYTNDNEEEAESFFGFNSSLIVTKSIHLMGCCFNRKYSAQRSCEKSFFNPLCIIIVISCLTL